MGWKGEDREGGEKMIKRKEKKKGMIKMKVREERRTNFSKSVMSFRSVSK